MRQKLMLLVLFTLVMGIMSLPVVSAQEPGILRFAISADPEHLNPFRSITVATRRIIVNVYEALTTLDSATAALAPQLADSWDISDDGLVYTFHLKPGVLFQEFPGVTYTDREVKADDWVWSMKTFLSGDEEVSAHPEYLASVVGAEAFTKGEATDVEGIKVIDDYTLQLTLTAPNHRFLFDLINVNVVPQEAYEQLPDFSNTPVGTGPFIFQEWKRDDRFTFTKNNEYWDAGLPKLDGLQILNVPDANNQVLMYRENQLDLLLSFPAGQRSLLLGEFASEAVQKPSLNVSYYGFNMKDGFFADKPLVRQALAYAVNRDEMWNTVMEGARVPGNAGVLSPDMPASDVAGYPYDPEKAKQLLSDAGYPEGQGLPTFDLYVLGSEANEPYIALTQAYLAQVGVNVNIVSEDDTTYWDHVGNPDVEIFWSGWSSDFADPSEVFNYLFLNGADDTNYNNPEINDMIIKAQSITSDEERNALYRQIHEMIMAESPWIVLGYGKVTFLQKPWVKGLEVSPAGSYRSQLKYVSVDG